MDTTTKDTHIDLLEGIVRYLPHAPCGHVAVGERPEVGRIIGRKLYGGEYHPYCDVCTPVVEMTGPMRPRPYPYAHAARAYNIGVLGATPR